MPTRGTPLRDCQAPRWSRGQIAHSLGTLSFSGPSRHATTCSLLSPSRVKERLRPALGAAAGGGDAGIDLGAKSNPCHSRNSGGLDLRAARACRGRAAPRPPASPAPGARATVGVTRADAGGRRPAPTAGQAEQPAAPFVSRSTSRGRARREQGTQAQEEEVLRASFEAKGPCAPCAPTRRGPQLYLFQWTRGGISERAGGRASGLPHLGGSEKPRVTAPHLAGPPLASTSLPGAGRRGGAGGGD